MEARQLALGREEPCGQVGFGREQRSDEGGDILGEFAENANQAECGPQKASDHAHGWQRYRVRGTQSRDA